MTAMTVALFHEATILKRLARATNTGECLEWVIEAGSRRLVSAVIPSYNSKQWLDACISSLLTQDGVQVSVAVVDNGSADGSARHVRIRWPTVRVEDTLTNLGYGASINHGVELLPRGDVLAVNADAHLCPGALGYLCSVLDDDRSVGAVAPCLVNDDGTLQPSAYRFPTLPRMLGRAVLLHHIPGVGHWLADLARIDYSHRTYVDWAAGAALLIRREAWEAVAGFDPGYFFFVEEIDLQRRLTDAGWRIALEPVASAVHYGGHQPISSELFLHAHDGFTRYFGLMRGTKGAVLARASLCLGALTRAGMWTTVALVRRARRREALEWASMFGRVFLASLSKLPRALNTSHDPYRGGRPA
jgi:N-acetylglucosaminyl-diphospho-decaprenol L-rhamnosyltransferase